MRKFFAIIIPMMLLAGNARAQAYKYEIGAAVGIGAYVGDANTNPFHKPGAAYGVIFRQNINYRWAIKYDLATTRMRGTTEGLGYAFPDGLKYSFSRQVLDFGAQAEFNFFSYGVGESYKETRRFSPYITAGIGFTAVPRKGDGYFNLNIPLGVGLKYKIGTRWNIGLEFTMRKTLGDKLDGKALKDPYRISSKIFKNTDWYSLTIFTISYDIGRKGMICNNL